MNFEITETRDWELVWRISQSPGVAEKIINDEWREMGDDVREKHVEIVVTDPRNHTLLVKNGNDVFGCFVLIAGHDSNFEVHTMLMSNCRGIDAIRAGKLAIKFAFTLPDVEHLFSFCPGNNRPSHLFALLCGWKDSGMSAFAWIQDGVAWPRKIVTLDKTEAPCH